MDLLSFVDAYMSVLGTVCLMFVAMYIAVLLSEREPEDDNVYKGRHVPPHELPPRPKR